MNKQYCVVGSSWTAIVNVEVDANIVNNPSSKELKDLITELSTKALEVHFKRKEHPDVLYTPVKKSFLVESFDKQYPADNGADEFRETVVNLISEELVPDCGVGMILSVVDMDYYSDLNAEDINNTKEYEWYTLTGSLLADVGRQDLAKVFKKKFAEEQKVGKQEKKKKKN